MQGLARDRSPILTQMENKYSLTPQMNRNYQSGGPVTPVPQPREDRHYNQDQNYQSGGPVTPVPQPRGDRHYNEDQNYQSGGPVTPVPQPRGDRHSNQDPYGYFSYIPPGRYERPPEEVVSPDPGPSVKDYAWREDQQRRYPTMTEPDLRQNTFEERIIQSTMSTLPPSSETCTNSTQQKISHGWSGHNTGLFVWLNVVFLIAAILQVGIGTVLMGFYRLHFLSVITLEFALVPYLMLAGGALGLVCSIFGFFVLLRDRSCTMVTYALLLTLEFCVLIAGLTCAIKLLFEIMTGTFDSDIIPELALYSQDSYVKYKWDTLQREYACCGGYGYTLGYTDWKHTDIGGMLNSVPDSCCNIESPSCGSGVFKIVDLRVIIGKINMHGCITIMMRRLETHVVYILIVYAALGALIAIIHVLVSVSFCCQARRHQTQVNLGRSIKG